MQITEQTVSSGRHDHCPSGVAKELARLQWTYVRWGQVIHVHVSSAFGNMLVLWKLVVGRRSYPLLALVIVYGGRLESNLN